MGPRARKGADIGLMSWIRGRKSGGGSTRVETHSTSLNLASGPGSVMRDGVEVSDPAERRAIIDEVDRLAHQFLTSSAIASGSHDAVAVTSSATIIMDGRPVTPDDPRARQKMLEAVAKLRAQGLDDLADDIARQLGVTSGAAADVPQVASTAQASAAAAGQVAADTGAAADEGPAEPTPPTPPVPPSPPSG